MSKVFTISIRYPNETTMVTLASEISSIVTTRNKTTVQYVDLGGNFGAVSSLYDIYIEASNEFS